MKTEDRLNAFIMGLVEPKKFTLTKSLRIGPIGWEILRSQKLFIMAGRQASKSGFTYLLGTSSPSEP